MLRRNVLQNIPFTVGDRKLTGDAVANVILLRVSYERKAEELSNFLQEVVKGLKPDGYDERERAVADMTRVEEMEKGDGEKPSSDDIEKARKTRNDVLEMHNEEREALERSFSEANEKKLSEETTIEGRPLSRQAFSDICSLLGVDGEMEFRVPGRVDSIPINKVQFLSMVGDMVEE